MTAARSAISIFLAFALLLQSATKTIVAAYWSLNQKWIAENLCEKRFEKNACCEGSCQLKKWTADDEKTKDQSSFPFQNLKNLKEGDSIFEPLSTFSFPLFFDEKRTIALVFRNEKLPRAPFLDRIGKPPQA